MSFRKTPVIIVLIIFIVGLFLFNVFGVGGFSTVNGDIHNIKPRMEAVIDIERIKSNMDNMTIEEIEETILEIEREIKRLELQTN